jgi:hypothetical protein
VRAEIVVSERGSLPALHALHAEPLTGHIDQAEIMPAIGLADHGASTEPNLPAAARRSPVAPYILRLTVHFSGLFLGPRKRAFGPQLCERILCARQFMTCISDAFTHAAKANVSVA